MNPCEKDEDVDDTNTHLFKLAASDILQTKDHVELSKKYQVLSNGTAFFGAIK